MPPTHEPSPAAAAKGHVIWLTGISGAGKSTLAGLLHARLLRENVPCEYIDGEDVREFFGHDLSFTRQERLVNLKRIVYAAKLLARHGVTTVVAAVAPYYEGRDFIRRQLDSYIQIYVEVSVAEAMARDTKGHYKNFALGLEKNLNGMDEAYEVPRSPDLIIRTGGETVDESLAKIVDHLAGRGILRDVRSVGQAEPAPPQSK